MKKVILPILMMILVFPLVSAELCDKSSYANLIENQNGPNPHTIYEVCEPQLCLTPSNIFSFGLDQLAGSSTADIYRIYEQESSYYDPETKKTVKYNETIETKTDTISLQSVFDSKEGKQDNGCYKIKIKGEWKDCQTLTTPGSWTTKALCEADNIISWASFTYSEWIEWVWETGNWPGIFSNTESDGKNLTLIPNKAHWGTNNVTQTFHFQFEGSGNDSTGKWDASPGILEKTTGYKGQAYNFSTKIGNLTVNGTVTGLGQTNISISAWIYPMPLVPATNGMIFHAGVPQGLPRIDFSYARTLPGVYYMSFLTYNQTYVNPQYECSNSFIDHNMVPYNWYFVVVTLQRVNSTVSNCQIHVDGIVRSNTNKTNIIRWDSFSGTRIGTSMRSLTFNGTIDEVILWNKTLSSTEIKEIYDFMKANYTQSGNNTLNPLQFNGALWSNWTNVSWVQTKDPSTNITIKIETSNDNITYSLIAENISNSYVQANISRYIRITPQLYTDNTNITPFLESLTVDYEQPELLWIAETHTPGRMTEMILGNFNFNLTANDNIDNLNATFYWNSSTPLSIPETKSKSGQLYGFNIEFTIPLISEDKLSNFWWNITKHYVNGSSATESFMYEVSVLNTLLINCTAGNSTAPSVLNFTFGDEQDPTTKLISTMEATFTIWKDTKSINFSFPFELEGLSQYKICLTLNGSYWQMDAIIDFESSDYSKRTFHIINETLNSTGNVASNDLAYDLYLLLNNESTGVEIQVQNVENENLPGYYVGIKKYYPGLDKYYTMAKPRTNYEGITHTYLNLFDTEYEFKIYDRAGTLVQTFSKFEVLNTDVLFTLSAVSSSEIYQEFAGITHSLTNTSNSFVLTYTTDSSRFEKMCLQEETIGLQYTTITCEECSTAQSDTLTCTIPAANGTYKASAIPTLTGSLEGSIAILTVIRRVTTLSQLIPKELANFLTLSIVGTLAFLGFISPPIGIVLTVAGLGISHLLGLSVLTLSLLGTLILIGGYFIITSKR